MTNLQIIKGVEYIIQNDEYIPLPKGTICFLLGKELKEKDGIHPNDFRNTNLYDIETICSIHKLYSKDRTLIFETTKIHEMRHFVLVYYKKKIEEGILCIKD